MTPALDREAVPPAGAHWRGLEVGVMDDPPGRYENAPRAEHRVMIHLGAPARVTCRHDDTYHTRLQTRGDIDFVPAGSASVWQDDDPTSTMSVWLDPNLMAAAARGMARGEPRRLPGPRVQRRDDGIFRLGLLLKGEVGAEHPSDPLFIDSIGMALAARILELYGCAEPIPSGARLSKPKLRLALDYIEGRLDGEVRLADLAELTRLSPSHFRVLFRQTVRRPLHRYVIERRVRRAKGLIENGGLSISQAALESGFCHPSHLARRMRQVLGLTPSELRRGDASPLGSFPRFQAAR
ncbi:MAG: helix-turn-helix transcriptional regulator [Caulobacteraceae bacterium]|nr:helix-turn-helix transcriptional regulator [Caulobacteraceae bacterium]